jgi:transcription elongation factor Elf1
MDTVIRPQQLNSIKTENACMFCIKPLGSTYINYIDCEDNLGYFNCGLCTLAMENALELWYDLSNFVNPERLVFVRIENNCMFCEHPTGPAYGRFVDIEAKYGYIYCDKCESSADKTMELWNKYFAYGRVNHLQDKDIKIIRSSGIVESGWKIYSPFIGYGLCRNEIIHCYNPAESLTRWCLIDDIIELNPIEKPVCEDNKPVSDVERLSPIFE